MKRAVKGISAWILQTLAIPRKEEVGRSGASPGRPKVETILSVLPFAVALLLVPWAIHAGIAGLGCPEQADGHLPISVLLSAAMHGISQFAAPILSVVFWIPVVVIGHRRKEFPLALAVLAAVCLVLARPGRLSSLSMGYVTSGTTASPCGAAGGSK
jgi:hypothetical protein